MITLRRVHYLSGIIITLFIALHLFNHVYSVFGAEHHIQMMNWLRLFYRNIFIEIILLSSVMVQIYSGIKLFITARRTATSNFEKLHIWTGLYLATFFVIHLAAVLGGRLYLNLDTNFYFGAAGLNSFPFNLFFIPYYALAIISFFGHIACVHHKKMKKSVFGFTPKFQSKAIIIFGICLTVAILYGLTNHFNGVKIPVEYNILIGK